MFEIVKRPGARQDLKAIWRYSFLQWGEKQADKYLAELAAGIARFGDNPWLGKPRDDLRPGYLSPFGYSLFQAPSRLKGNPIWRIMLKI